MQALEKENDWHIRRVVMPPLPKDARWAERAIEPRHLRAIEVGCGPDKQRVWLPMPHFKEPWCSGVDFLYEIDYRAVAPSIPPADVPHIRRRIHGREGRIHQ